MDVDDALWEAVEEAGSKQVHVPGADHELDAAPLEPVGHRGVALVPICKVVELEHPTRHTGRLRPRERAGARDVRRDGDHGQACVEQRLEVRSLAADEDADHARTIVPITSASPGSGVTAT